MRALPDAFDNTDGVQHNVVVVRPGTLDAFGEAVDAFSSDPSAADRDYVPDVEGVLFTMGMVDARDSGTITFVAPTTPGDYPFVCTFPGHWRTMNGVLRVEG